MRDCLTLGPVPAEESCAQVGEPSYYERARRECEAYRRQLREQFATEFAALPDGVDCRLNMQTIRQANADANGHWFDRDTIRFFNSRVLDSSLTYVCGNHAFFVTSERYSSSTPRLFSVRKFTADTGMVTTEGAFQGYPTRAQAITACKQTARA
jgi:hypothetical protein